MAFRFSLESILRLRQGLERQEEQKLAQAAQQAAKMRVRLKELEHYFQETQRQWRSELESSNLVAALHLGLFSQAGYLRARQSAALALGDAERELGEQVRRYRDS